MANEPDNLTLVIVRRIEDRLVTVETKLDRVSDDMRDMKVRMSSKIGRAHV